MRRSVDAERILTFRAEGSSKLSQQDDEPLGEEQRGRQHLPPASGSPDDEPSALPRYTPSVRAAAENESFELALATLKFVPAVNTVVVVLPAPQGAPADHVMVVRRDDATTALTPPLKDALGWKTTPA